MAICRLRPPACVVAALLALADRTPGHETARTLEKRWRAAMKNKKITEAELDAIGTLEFGEAGSAQGLEPKREAPIGAAFAFPHKFAIGSSEHSAWLQNVGSI